MDQARDQRDLVLHPNRELTVAKFEIQYIQKKDSTKSVFLQSWDKEGVVQCGYT